MSAKSTDTRNSEDKEEPRWTALVALLAIGGLYLALPRSLTVGPRWLPLVIVIVLIIPTMMAHRRQWHTLNHVLGHLISGIVTVFMLISLSLLIHALPQHQEAPTKLLKSAVALWLTNVLVFASWYWRLDGGGPHERFRQRSSMKSAFLFPQIMFQEQQETKNGHHHWSPTFIDYLFLAFNTSTALSPTDTAVVDTWAKLMMMLQSLISLSVVAFLAARAVNIL